MSEQQDVQALQEENAQLHALVQHQREELEQVAFFKDAIKDPRVKQGLYLYRKGLGVPFASFSQWCVKGRGQGCQCWRCLADRGFMASLETERNAMAESAMSNTHQRAKIEIMAADGDQQAIEALLIAGAADASTLR